MHRWTIGAVIAVTICAYGLVYRGSDEGRAGPAPPALVAEAAYSDDSLGWVVDLALTGGRLVGIDALLDPSVHVFDLESVERLGSYGRRGDGPGEFRDPEQIVPGATDSPDEVWILDGVHQRLTRLSLGEIETGSVAAPETFRMDGPNAGSLVHAPDGRWFAGGWITGGRVARYRADRSYDRTIVGFPPEADAPGMTLLQAYESRVVADPGGGRLAAGTLLGGLLEIFDYDGVPIAQAAVPDPFQPVWRQGRSRGGRAVMSLGPETRYGFTDLVATGRYVYGLFSGRSVAEPGTPWATPEVQVYTWDGAYLKTLHLDRAAEAFTVDAIDTWLYASGPDPEPWVGRFRLPEELIPRHVPTGAGAEPQRAVTARPNSNLKSPDYGERDP
ncbi:BF3164 family lipoprotein [Candidatus Palauibacter sp.]|uniref:BF3164 family lipoprotein n=1 Tax=Candidatus Palauibacter sp. TaxID=3101350 RepID=UPI003B01D39B